MNTNPKKAGVAILMSNKLHFRAKNITRDKEAHFPVIKEAIHRKDIIILNLYEPNNRASKYMKQNPVELKAEIGKSKIIIIDFNTLLSMIDRTIRKKFKMNIEDSNNTINKLDLTLFDRGRQ